MSEVDEDFYDRADDHINLSNSQLKSSTHGKVSTSMMYRVARFNAWVSAIGWKNSEEMAEAKTETLDYFVTEYKKMLEENLDEYILKFDEYIK